MQDLSHKFVFAAQQLESEPSMNLIIEDTTNENVMRLMLKILTSHGVSRDRLVFFDLGCLTAGRPYCREYIEAKEMYVTEVYPVGWIMSAVPTGLGASFHRALVPIDPAPQLRKKILILHREPGGTRSFGNLNEVKEALEAFAALKGLDREVQVIYGDSKGVLETGATVAHAAIIVAPHGGQTYNVAFACSGTVFIEVLPALRTHDGPYTIHSYSASFGHNYWMLPITGVSHRDDKPMQVPIPKLKQILERAFV